MASRQRGGCAICREKKRLCVDHCHVSKKVRGLLCRECNIALGLLNDSVARLKRAVKYLIKT